MVGHVHSSMLSLSDRCLSGTTRMITPRIRWVALFILTCALGCSAQDTSENPSGLNDGFMGEGGERQSDASVPSDDGAGSSEADAQAPDASIEAPA